MGKKKKRHVVRNIFVTLLVVFCIGVLGVLGLFSYYIATAPKLDESKLEAQPATKIYDKDKKLVQTLGDSQRDTIETDEIPQQLKSAIISIEDRRFYNHIGVDPIRIAGALFSNIRGNALQGGSTLTQQLIKLSYFSTKEQDQTLKRKVQEAWLSIQLEQKVSKDQILDYYINKVYMNNQLYGMQTASKAYYGKSLDDLDLAQTALLAGMPQAPTLYDPYTHPKEATARRNMVLKAMYENDKITKAEYEKAEKESIKDGLKPLKQEDKQTKLLDNYVTQAVKEVEEETGKNPYLVGMDIYTNLDLDAQKQLYQIMNDNSIVPYPVDDPHEKGDEMKSAATVMDVNNGRVVAQLGDRDVKKEVQQGQNLAVDGKRDVGSTVKPFTDYAPAIEYLHYSTAKRVVDQPYYYSDTRKKVSNYDLTYKGTMTMKQALIDSRNVPAMEFFDAVGANRVEKFLKTGFDYEIAGGINQASAISQDMSSLKLASIYTAFANGGTYYKPTYVNKVVFANGEEQEIESKGQRAMSEATAYMITDMLKGVINQGTGSYARIPGIIQAGKTGTSNYEDKVKDRIIGDKEGVPDVTFVGYTTDYCISVWSGYTNYFHSIAPEYAHNSQLVYRNMMSYMMQNEPVKDWTQPDDVVRIGDALYVKGYTSNQNVPLSEDSETIRQNLQKDGHMVENGEATPASAEEGGEMPQDTSSSSSQEQSQGNAWETPTNTSGTTQSSSASSASVASYDNAPQQNNNQSVNDQQNGNQQNVTNNAPATSAWAD